MNAYNKYVVVVHFNYTLIVLNGLGAALKLYEISKLIQLIISCSGFSATIARLKWEFSVTIFTWCV